MKAELDKPYHYTIMDPTGNITALVTSCAEISRQPFIAGKIMERHPEVEQVGFVFIEDAVESGLRGKLRMAGGEFCGNAAMSTAALFALTREPNTQSEMRCHLNVSGAEETVEIRLRKEGNENYAAGVKMPAAIEIKEQNLEYSEIKGSLPLVRMQGISHLIIEADSPFTVLKENKEDAERAAKKWCREFGAEGLGLMFLSGARDDATLTPLVYIPKSNTIFWEHSCGSGSSACGFYFSEKEAKSVRVTLKEPGGTLRVEGNRKELWLYGNVKRIGEYQL